MTQPRDKWLPGVRRAVSNHTFTKYLEGEKNKKWNFYVKSTYQVSHSNAEKRPFLSFPFSFGERSRLSLPQSGCPVMV